MFPLLNHHRKRVGQKKGLRMLIYNRSSLLSNDNNASLDLSLWYLRSLRITRLMKIYRDMRSCAPPNNKASSFVFIQHVAIAPTIESNMFVINILLLKLIRRAQKTPNKGYKLGHLCKQLIKLHLELESWVIVNIQ